MEMNEQEVEIFNELRKKAQLFSIYKKYLRKGKYELNPEYDLDKTMEYYKKALDMYITKYGKFREYVDELGEYDVYGNLLYEIANIYATKTYSGVDLKKSIELCLEIIKDDNPKLLHEMTDNGLYYAYVLLGKIYSNRENEKYGIKVDGKKAKDYFQHSPADGWVYIADMYNKGELVEKDCKKAEEYLDAQQDWI